MGLVSQAVHAGGRHVLGVISKYLMPREITGETVGEVCAVSDMHERKDEKARRADAFIALPGGYETLEELLEVITWAQLGIHNNVYGDGVHCFEISTINANKPPLEVAEIKIELNSSERHYNDAVELLGQVSSEFPDDGMCQCRQG